MTDSNQPELVAAPRALDATDGVTAAWHCGLLRSADVLTVAVYVHCDEQTTRMFHAEENQRLREGGKRASPPIIAAVEINGPTKVDMWMGLQSGIDPYLGMFHETASLSSGDYSLHITISGSAGVTAQFTQDFRVS